MHKARAFVAVSLAVAALTGCTGTPTELLGPRPAPGPKITLDPEAGRSDPVADPIYPEHGNPAIDVLVYKLDLIWNPTDKRLTGIATLTIRPVKAVSEIALDFLGEYTVNLVTVDGAAATHTRRGDDLIVATPEPLPADGRTTLVVGYSGTPRPTPTPSTRPDAKAGLGLRAEPDGSAWTLQEPYGAFTWFPVNDHPSDEALYDLTVTVPEGWSGVAHGSLVSTTQVAGGRRFRWVSVDPVASYVTTLAIGRYEKIEMAGPHGLPLTFWVRPTGRDKNLSYVLWRTPEMLAWLEERFGPYPFPSLGAVFVDAPSAMETQQMVTLGNSISASEPHSEQADRLGFVLFHEYAHQWFGDAVTNRDWRGLWLNEGFAMYVQALWAIDSKRGDMDWWLKQARDGDRASRPVAGPPGAPKPGHFAEDTVYDGGMLMLHEIHETIGDKAFYALCRDWVQTHRNKSVDREMFVKFVNAHTKRDFTAVINKWLDSPTTPR